MAKADSIGGSSFRMKSSVTSSGQFCTKLCMADSAPARPSNVNCQVKASPLAFSESSSLGDLGNMFLQNKRNLGKTSRTTGTPSVITAPTRSHPAWVRVRDILLFWLALRRSSSAVLNITLPLLCGTPSGDRRTPPRIAAKALLYL